MSPSLPSPLTARRDGPLTGRARVPGDKSVSHRTILMGLLTVGETSVEGLLEGEDVLRTVAAARALGAHAARGEDGRWRLRGVGVGGLNAPRDTLDFGNAGTGARLVMGLVAGHDITATFDGDASLRRRPMRRVLDPLERMGAEVLAEAPGGRMPLTLRGARDAVPVIYETPVPSAQVKSAVLLAGLNAPGATTVIEAEATRDHTEAMLARAGAEVSVEPHGAHGRRITLRGRPELTPQAWRVPGDPSSAAFPLVAALLVEGSEVVLEGVMVNPLRDGLILTLREMGADIAALNPREGGGGALADLRVRASRLRCVDVPAARAPTMIDEYPVLAVAAAFAQGETRMRGLCELRAKESDRLAAVAAGLAAIGARARIEGDDLVVDGTGTVPGGGTVATHLDHRIAMAFLVAGFAARDPVTVDDGAMIATSFPGFEGLMRGLGADLA